MEIKTDNQNNNDIHIKRKDNSKVYFFVIAIVALLLTNVYFYVKFKSSGEKLYTIALQKENLQIQIDRIEAELDNIQREQNAVDSDEIVQGEQNVRTMIADLRSSLDAGDLSDVQLDQLRKQVNALKLNVTSLKEKIEDLKLQNDILVKEKLELSSTIHEKDDKVHTLENNNRVLREKVGVASSIKVSNIVVNGIEFKRRGRKEIETKAKRVDELQIQFSIADNPLAKIEHKDVYVRIVDPNGTLIANSQDVFNVNNDQLQYTFKEKIQFTNNGEEYELLWENNKQGFKKGVYTILLYADNAIMGRTSIVLK